ncbi:endolytic transglycosylase MltG [Leucobacter tenebrionis]|uniref:endolytic transglycosylase MltG n=1 Tax=Leucobacter tenebrionis TaxID=2873270 RepID=UPI001CA6D1C1|nr:endolytic transglycosylase MltG [Leucobacter tenebrionis]QZY52210.1 endolytic transglycosylase MltG [Leucobacter tenebrionis]
MNARTRDDSRRTGRRVLISLLVALVLLGGLAAAGGYLWTQYGEQISLAMGWSTNDYDDSDQGEETTVTIREGEIGEDIAASLEKAGVVKTSDAFYELLLAQEPQVEFLPGIYTVRERMSSQAALEALQDPENRQQLSATLPEGLTIEGTLELLSEGSGIPYEEFVAAAENPAAYGLPEGVPSLEGWLFPATYEFSPEMTAEDIIGLLVSHQVQVLDEFGVAEADRERVLTIASIVQREGRNEDFSKISQVIHKRLEVDMALGMDSTAQYGSGEHGSFWSSDEALSDDNPWNTYVHKGLPIGPISNPGRAAIDAALHPADTDWLYFVNAPGGDGALTFTTNEAEHEAAIQEYRDWCAATPDSGC